MSALMAVMAIAMFPAWEISAANLVTPVRKEGKVDIMDRPRKAPIGKRLYGLEPDHRLRKKGRHDANWYSVALPDGRTGYAEARFLREVRSDALDFEVRFFNIKGSDSALITVGPTEVLIDGGGDPIALKHHIEPYIHPPLNLLVVTHVEQDHWSGLLELIKPDATGRKKIVEIWRPVSDRPCPVAGFEEFVASLPGPPVTKVVSSSVRPQRGVVTVHTPSSAPEVDITVLYVETPQGESNCNRRTDNRSLIFVVAVGGRRLLFTTDGWGRDPGEDTSISGTKYAEKALLAAYKHFLEKIDLVTVPNHGLSTTNTRRFVEGLASRSGGIPAIVFAGSNNGWPDDIVVNWYERHGITLYRTNQASGARNDHVVCTRGGNHGVSCDYQPASLPPGGKAPAGAGN